MSTELAIHNDVDDLKRIGTMLAMSGYFETAPNPTVAVAQMCTKVMAGRELGFGPFASATGIHIIKGKPSIGANLMAAAVKAHPRYDYRVRKMADDIVSVEFFELEDGKRVSVGVSEFTAKDAQAAGTQNMGKFPRNMLFARAMSNGVRWYCPDVFLGSAVYVPEELGAEVDAETGEILQGGYTIAPQRPQEPPSAPPAQNGTPSTSLADDVQFGDAGQVRPDWKLPAHAKAWAVEVGACANEFEATNSLRKIVESTEEGKLTTGNQDTVYDAFYERQMEKLAAAKQQQQAA